jgi:hypothetical protein
MSAIRDLTEASYPAIQPTGAELTAIRRGRAAFRRGDYAPLKEVLDDLESADQATDERR